MKKRRLLGLGVGLICLAGTSDAAQAQTIYNSIGHNNASQAEIRLYDANRRQLERQPRPEPERPGHTGAQRAKPPKRHRSLLDEPSG